MSDPRNHVTPPSGQSPGALLRNKRIENGWTASDVAQALYLSAGQLEALENDDYPNLPGRIYVLGYWKNYASLLGLPIEEFVNAHRGNLPETTSGIALEPDHRQARSSAEQSRHRLAISFVLLSVIFLLAIWYWQTPDSGDAPEQIGGQAGVVPGTPALRPDTGTTGTPGALSDAGESQGEGQYADPPEPSTALPEPNFSEENDPARFDTEADTEADAGAPGLVGRDAVGSQGQGRSPEVAEAESGASAKVEVRSPEAVSGDGGDDVAAASPPAATVAPTTDSATASTSAPAEPALPPNQIVFVVTEKSWIEVQDGADQRLIYRTVQRGQRVTLQGEPPFSVFIGNAQGVAVEYRGKPVSFTAGRRGLFARFQVGAPR